MSQASASVASAAQAVLAGADLAAKVERGAKPMVLCIEDDWDTATLIAEELEQRGFDVVVANDGREGWALLLRSRPDVIVCDINLPYMSGLEILESLTAIAPRFARVPFIFLTALNARAD